MKTNMKIFTVLMFALTTMPALASQSNIEITVDENTQSEVTLAEVSAVAPKITQQRQQALLKVAPLPTKTVDSNKIKITETTRDSFSEEYLCETDEGGSWDGKTCNCPNLNEHWDSASKTCVASGDATISTIKTSSVSTPAKAKADDVKIAEANTPNPSKEDLEERRRQIKEESDCNTRNGTWDAKKGCLCNDKPMKNNESVCLSPEEQAVETIKKTPATIGASITFDADIANKSEIRDAFSDWQNACKKNTADGALKIDVSTKGSNRQKMVKTCLIITCDEEHGYKEQPSNNGKSCEKTSEQKKAEKNVDKIIKAIDKSIASMKVGEKIGITISREQEHDKDIEPKLDEWRKACYKAVANTPNVLKSGETIDKGLDHAATAGWTCLIGSCNAPDYITSSDRKSCIKSDDKEEVYNNAFIGQFDHITSAYEKTIEKLKPECKENNNK